MLVVVVMGLPLGMSGVVAVALIAIVAIGGTTAFPSETHHSQKHRSEMIVVVALVVVVTAQMVPILRH